MTSVCIAVLAATLLATPVTTRFSSIGHEPATAEWLSVYEGRLAFGSGNDVTVTAPDGRVERSLVLDRSIERAVLADSRLYVAQGSWIGIVDLTASGAVASEHRLTPAARGTVHPARMGDFLVLAENGLGLRFLTLPPPARHRTHEGHHDHATALEDVGRLRIDGVIDAIAVSVRTIYVAVRDEGIAVIDATDVETPHLERVVPLGFAPHALAADGARLFTLSADGLRVVDLTLEAPAVAGPFDTHGSALAVAGRRIDLASGESGLVRLFDRTPEPVLASVGVSNFDFTPAIVSVQPGDTVTWQNNGGFHNVESCDGSSGAGGNDPDPPGCPAGAAVEGFFTNGAPSPVAWTYNRQFNLLGDNPYFCEAHATFGMLGTVTVSGALPPAVPNGVTGPPLLLTKLSAGAASMQVQFDTTTCSGNGDHQLIYGFGSQLPAAAGGTYSLAGAECGIGGSPHVWNGVPDPAVDPSDLLWFLAVATDGGTVEGSWGRDSAGNQRNSPIGGGESGLCSIDAKDLSNACGQ